MSVVKVDQLCVRYGATLAVDHLSFTAEAGEITVLLGPNGAGKTSTIECLEGYRQRDSGSVTVCGLDPIEDRTALNRRVGVMLQSGGLPTAIRPREATRLYASFYDNPRDPEDLLRFVGLEHRARTPYRSLSGGEQQRLSLALAIIGHPEVAFLDEPTAGVDLSGRQLIRELIAELREDGVAVVLTTHDLAEVEAVADRIIIIDAGRKVADGTPAELLNSDSHDYFTFRAGAGLDSASLSAAIGASVAETEAGRYVVHTTPSPPAVAALTNWLLAHDELLGDLQAGRQRLEEVFLKLTGDEPTAVPRGRSRRVRSER